MSMGKRKRRQESLFITADNLPRSDGHPFYQRLNALLAEANFDRWIEARCGQYYAQDETRGQPSIPPGVYFRMLLVGYFEDISSQRGIAWRCADSLSLRAFLGVPLDRPTPDHSTMSVTRKRLGAEVFDEVFRFVLAIADEKRLLAGKTVGVDSTTLEANAAMKSIVRRDTGEDWRQYVARLMHEDGTIEADHEPSDDELRRYDKQRKKTVSNEDWVSPTDPEARITKMKDGRTHLAYKAEHVVDLDSEILLAAEVRPADHADQQTLVDSVIEAKINLEAAGSEVEIEEVVADKGYHANATLELAADLNLRTYIPEPRLKDDRVWTNKPPAVERAVVNNRRRMAREGQTVGASAERACGAELCPRVRHRRRAAFVAARAGRRDQTLPLGGRGAQPGADHAIAVWNRQAAGAASSRRACLACAVYRHGFLADDQHRGEPIDGRRPWLVRVGDALTNPRPEAVT